MITHYIIMSSSYSIGKRIAIHYLFEKSKYEELNQVVKTIMDKCGKDVSISTHCIETDSTSWESVEKSDHFFKDVKVIKSIDIFIDLIQQDRVLSGLDVAKYILCKVKCTHLKLQKLTYLCFAEYLCDYNKELYQDRIYAYKYGPVVEQVYNKYKKYGYKEIEHKEIDARKLYRLPAKSRILFAADGLEKISSIEKTLEKYGHYTANQLVKLTHQFETPWDVLGKGEFSNVIIDNDTIKKYHCNEVV